METDLEFVYSSYEGVTLILNLADNMFYIYAVDQLLNRDGCMAIEFPKGLVFQSETGKIPIRLANGLRIVKDNNGIWQAIVNLENQITVSFDDLYSSEDSKDGIYFNAQITEGLKK